MVCFQVKFSRNPQAKFSLHYDKLVVDKEVFTYNELSGRVEADAAPDERCRSPVRSPTPQKGVRSGRSLSRTSSRGKKKKVEKSFSVGKHYDR